MTEERMICEKSHREINHPEHGEITEIWWCPVEPAPPKGFSPKCARIDELNEIKGVVAPLVCSFDSCLLWNECPFKRIKR